MAAEKNGDDLVRGSELATPRQRAEARILELLDPAAKALLRILTLDPSAFETSAQSAGLRVQLEAATHVLDGCLGMTTDKGQTKSAARILTAVGSDAVTRELARRYAQKQSQSERARFVSAVPAQVEDAVQDSAQPTQGSTSPEHADVSDVQRSDVANSSTDDASADDDSSLDTIT